MEVVEHISSNQADEFICKLCSLSDIVCFSAALPGQGGVAHVNEKRLSYWIEKFNSCGYEPYDIIRGEIWRDKKIPVWYRNNIIIFCKSDCERKIRKDSAKTIVDIVHPELYEKKVKYYEEEIRRLKASRKVGIILKENLCRTLNKIKRKFQ